MKISQAAAYLDLCQQRVRQLVEAGTLKRLGVDRPLQVTPASVEAYRERIERRNEDSMRWPPTRANQRAIVQTLLLAGVMTKRDVAEQEGRRLRKAIRAKL